MISPDMGKIPSYILNMPEHKRGNHPICSISGIGKYSKEIIKTQLPLSVYAPYEKILL